MQIHGLFGLVLCLLSVAAASGETVRLLVGTYTRGDSEGIYALRFDTETGALHDRALVAKSENPSFLAFHPDGKHLYAVNETSSGELSAFRISPETGQLAFLNKVPSGGGAPCHLSVDRTGKSLLVANYAGGNVSSTRIEADGSLGKQISFVQHRGSSVNAKRQQAPHAHSINLDSENRFAVAADLGTDELIVYRFNARTSELKTHGTTKLPPGSGPRHFCFDRRGDRAYVINELTSTVAALTYDGASGRLAVRQVVSTLPDDFDGSNSTAEIRVSADGRFVYGSNRGHDSIAVFRADAGKLTRIQVEPIGGKTPRNFNFDPTGRFLLAAGQSTNDIHVFRIDPDSGKLTRTEHRASVPSPVCLRFEPR